MLTPKRVDPMLTPAMIEEKFVTEATGAAHWPVALMLRRDERVLEVAFDDGSKFVLPAMLLRVESPSAEVQGHHASQKQPVLGKEQVGISAIEPVGNYAVRIIFDDGHDTGIYTWTYLYKLGLSSGTM